MSKIEPLISSDVKSIPRLQPSGWQDITPWIAFYTQSSFCFPVKLIIDDNIAAIGCGIQHTDVAWIAHIIVHPDHRNKGLGTLITKSIVDTMLAKGSKTLNLVATDLGEPVYKKLGFKTESEYCFFKEIKPVNDSTELNIIRYETRFENDVPTLDRMASAEDRTFHWYPHLKNGYFYLEENRLTGFYLPTFGDGCIFSTTPQAGKSLMKFRFKEKDNACFPMDNKVALKCMYDLGYKETRVAKRMRLGPAIAWKPEMMYNRIAGNLG
jgi:GNAT superfamily N-acetyltransferase